MNFLKFSEIIIKNYKEIIRIIKNIENRIL